MIKLIITFFENFMDIKRKRIERYLDYKNEN